MSVENLRRQRGQLKAKLTTTKNFVNKVTKELGVTTLEEVTARLQGLEDTYQKFEAVMQQLIPLVPEEEYERRDATEYMEFEERYYEVKASLLQLIERLRPTSSSSSTSVGGSNGDQLTQILEQQTIIMRKLSERSESANSDVLTTMVEQQGRLLAGLNANTGTLPARESQVKLPIIKLPTFNGTMEDWRRYFDTFKTLIHDSELSNIQKHQYLVGSLSGPATNIIESIEISGDNYEVAWKLLVERYNDEKSIRRRHIQCLFALPQVQRESASAIQDLVDHVQGHLRMLQALKRPTTEWGDLIIHMIEDKLDSVTRRRWEEHIEPMDDITTDMIIEFLQRQGQLLRRSSSNKEINKAISDGHRKDERSGLRNPPKPKSQTKASLATTVQEGSCRCLCQGAYNIYSCKRFLDLSVADRVKQVKRLRLCLNCLRGNHYAKDCKAGSCRECGARHNTLCHETASAITGSAERPTKVSSQSSDGASVCAATGSSLRSSDELLNHRVLHRGERGHVLMSTAIVNARKSSDGDCQIRVLLDSASEVNFITSAACKRLNLKLDNIYESISGLDGMGCAAKQGSQIQLKSRVSNFKIDLYCLVVLKITKDLPSFSINVSRLSISENLKLADPFYYCPGRIDALIGGAFFYQLLQTGRIELGNDALILQNTKLGWIIAGPVARHLIVDHTTNRQLSSGVTCLLTQQESSDYHFVTIITS
ncbi:hypothetical protein X777_10003 [Ooceraea biroi]|uniref:Uncharacterized protein n=1 Tax=Ooceraea biroi TaxID=2015173 RepID=A0A026W5L0_OOCBI|nr:hypothetical protein X777_10003 [Ooceraea biroi]